MENERVKENGDVRIDSHITPVWFGIALLSAAATCLTCYSFCSSASPYLYMIPFIVNFACVFSYNFKPVFRAASIISTACAVFFAAFNFTKFLDGAKIYANGLFKMSEESQAYVYRMFETAGGYEGVSPQTVFAAVLITLFSLFFAHASVKRAAVVPVVTAIIYAETEIYLGIAPSTKINAFTFVCLFVLAVIIGAPIIKSVQRAYVQIFTLLAVLAVAVSALVYFAYPAEYHEENPAITEVAEKIRDWLDKREQAVLSALNLLPPEPQDADEEPEDFEEDDESPDNSDNYSEDEGEITYDPASLGDDRPTDGSPVQTQGGGKPKSHKLLIFLAVLGSLLLIWAAALIINAIRRKKRLNSDDLSDAVDYAFRQSFRWLRLGGFEKNNLPYLRRCDDIKSLTNEEYAYRYGRAVEIRQEALYSGRVPTSGKRDEMLLFYNESKRETANIIGIPKQIIAKLFRFM
ncbi:MAG: hypothetical protein IJK60_03810 [Clostridia bacterium]|nr:hypothetical protein [Clostridia bacterium]